jgi:PAS domain-containing protein
MFTPKRGSVSLAAVLGPYAIAAVSVAGATWVRLLLDPWLLDRAEFVTLFAAVTFTAWYGGISPALFALACGVLSTAFFVIEPRHSFAAPPSSIQFVLLSYAIVALGCALLIEALRTARLRSEERARSFSQAVLDALPMQLAVLNGAGSIIGVNEAWLRFAADNGGSPLTGVGANYLEVARDARGPGSEEGAHAAAGIRSVLSGASPRFTMEYPCPSPDRRRWFLLLAVLLRVETPHCVVAHVEITDRKLAEERLRESEERLRRVESQRERGPGDAPAQRVADEPGKDRAA